MSIHEPRIYDNDQEKKKENTLSEGKKKEGRKWKAQIRTEHLASFFRCIQFGRIDKWLN